MIVVGVIIRSVMNNIEIIKLALEEDLASGDVTTDPIFTDEQTVAKLIAKEDGIFAGTAVAIDVFKLVDPTVEVKFFISDGHQVKSGQLLAEISGLTKSILHGERVALNLIQRMSGVATLTNRYVRLTGESGCQIFDTRKTTPLLRSFERAAVVIGGGYNHRFNLGDQVLIKDNHIAAAGSITAALSKTKAANPSLKIEVECETIEQVRAALATGLVDIIMLDNMDDDLTRECVDLIANQAIVEASGNMTLERIAAVCATGVDRISVGNLTHSYTSLDISLKMGV